MAQTFTLPAGSDDMQTARTKWNNALLALQSGFSGTSRPSSIVDGQVWFDESDGKRKVADGVSDLITEEVFMPAFQSAASSTTSAFIYVPWNAEAVALVLVSNTNTLSNAGDRWTMQVYNRTQADDMFSTPPSTFGSELAANVAKVHVPDQETSINAGDVLEVQLIANGSPTSLGRVLVGLRVQRTW